MDPELQKACLSSKVRYCLLLCVSHIVAQHAKLTDAIYKALAIQNYDMIRCNSLYSNLPKETTLKMHTKLGKNKTMKTFPKGSS